MTRLRLFAYRFRRPLAAASAAFAVLLLASTLRPASPPTLPVVVAASDLPAGSLLSHDDLAVIDVPIDYAAPGALSDIATATGRTIAVGMVAGEAVSESRLLATSGRIDGLLTVHVRLADAEVAGLLEPGSAIDLVQLAGDAEPRVVAEAVRVVTVPRRTDSPGWGGTTRSAGSLIVVATDRRTAITLAAAGAQPGLGVVLR